MIAIRDKKLTIVLALMPLLAISVLFWTAHINLPYSPTIAVVKPSADGLTLTVHLVLRRPTSCEKVTDTAVQESTSQVLLEIQMYDTCSPLLSWGNVVADTLEGYPFSVNLKLQTPLAGRTLVDKATGQKIPTLER
ncbi:hypothetical protein [Microtetraspora malaysiensis]|uniref:hypothetical protein n=1 Tax=Microtetraspora malaysiensis TaxID=161358 RepID=UPI003D8E89D9